jgi:hypothetical protein
MLPNRHVTGALSPETYSRQNRPKVGERCRTDPRRAKGHPGARHRIQHPGREQQDKAGPHPDENKLPICAS